LLILASASQSRKNLLESSGINFVQIASNFNESIIAEKNVQKLALKLSISKAKHVFNKIKENNDLKIIKNTKINLLACDSIFEFKGEAYGKPFNVKEAYERWENMSGSSGYLHTGHCLFICDEFKNGNNLTINKEIKEVISSKLYFSKLEKKEILKYVETLEPLKCAGGFALEGRGGKYIERIEGCFSNVMGLSLPWLRKKLLENKIYA
tara:strand:- start:1334 stop:1960 length:627 start_codon:yes stop_codon:yes gene_type:complete